MTTGRSDRKSTRLNSSHLGISYAVFCLKKKINARGLREEQEVIVKNVSTHRGNEHPEVAIARIFFLKIRPPPRSTLFPYTPLFRSQAARSNSTPAATNTVPPQRAKPTRSCRIDRKSTRLNSSHLGISYAVFCLK